MLFDNFDFTVLEDPNFKEDSVREEIIAPLLKYLGYSASGPNRIVRSKGLLHPYSMIGSKKHKINIVPDYAILVNDRYRMIIEAKSPHVGIRGGDSVSQAYSYAIHPEIRAKIFALCNGKELVIYTVEKIEPIIVYNLANLNIDDFQDLYLRLNPKVIGSPEFLNFDLDCGIYLVRHGFPNNFVLCLLDIPVMTIGKLSENHYCMNVAIEEFADRKLLMSSDFDKKHRNVLLSIIDKQDAREILTALSKQPFYYQNEKTNARINLRCHLSGSVMTSTNGEDFMPFIVDEIF